MAKKKVIDLRVFLNLKPDVIIHSVEELSALVQQGKFSQEIYETLARGELEKWLGDKNGADRPDISVKAAQLSSKNLSAPEALQELKTLLKSSSVSSKQTQTAQAQPAAVSSAATPSQTDEKTAHTGTEAVKTPLSFLFSWGSYGEEKGQFNEPTGITVDSEGFVYVADTQNNRIQKFDKNGKFFQCWGEYGKANAQLGFPTGMATDSQGFLYVVEELNHRFQKFDVKGSFIFSHGMKGSRNGQFISPSGIAIDLQGFIYVSDKGNNRIQKYTLSGAFTKWKTESLDRAGLMLQVISLSRPSDITVDTPGNVYVLDTGNNRVLKFDKNGNFLLFWGGYGQKESQFSSPEGITVDSQGFVYVADTDNHRVQIFDSEGRMISRLGKPGSGDGEFNNPVDVAIDADSFIYVVDRGNHRIQKFQKR